MNIHDIRLRFDHASCSKCKGAGSFISPQGSRPCLSCSGSGKTLTKRGKIGFQAFLSIRFQKINASSIKPGDWIRNSGSPTFHKVETLNKWIDPDGRIWIKMTFHGRNGSYATFPALEIERLNQSVSIEEAINQALALS